MRLDRTIGDPTECTGSPCCGGTWTRNPRACPGLDDEVVDEKLPCASSFAERATLAIGNAHGRVVR